MKSRPDLAGARAIVALAFTLVFAACGDGGHDNGATASAPVAPPVAPPIEPPVAPPVEQPGVFRSLATWAGSPDPGGAGDADGTGSAARFQRPNRLTVASDGSLWITEIDTQRIRRIDAQGQVTTVFDASAMPPRTDASGRTVTLGHPGAMVAAPSGGVFVGLRQSTRAVGAATADDERWVVLRITAGAEPQVVVQPAPGARVGPSVTGLALDRLGRLSIGDLGCAIWRSDGSVLDTAQPRGVLLLHASGPASPGASCSSINRLTIDAQDRLLFTLASGEVQRLELNLSVNTLGRTSLGPAYDCGDMALDRAGGLLLTGGTPALMRLDAAGREQVFAGSPQQAGWFDGDAAGARFGYLCGVAVDGEGRIVVSDHIGHTVRRIAPDGSVSTVAGLAPQLGYRDGVGTQALFGEFFSVGAGVNGGVVVADPSMAVVRGVDARQRVSTVAGVATDEVPHSGTDGPVASARLAYPTSALMTADGSLWIGDGTVLRRLGPDGMVRTVTALQPGFQSVLAMALDRTGDVVVVWGTPTAGKFTYWTEHRFERYSASHPQAAPVGMALVVADDLSRRLGGLPMLGMCVLPDGAIVYSQHHAVLRRAADGTVSLLAGSPDETGTQDGAATVARFQWPSGLACDAAGGIYVADSGNHTVRYIDAQRNVRTVLGTPGRAGHRVDALPGELHGPRSLVLVTGGLVVSTGQGLVRAGF
jgi:sugar lactone lactonase YvrE